MAMGYWVAMVDVHDPEAASVSKRSKVSLNGLELWRVMVSSDSATGPQPRA